MLQETVEKIIRNAYTAHIPMEARARLATNVLQRELDQLYKDHILRIPLIGVVYAEDEEFLRYAIFKSHTLGEIESKDYDKYIRK